MGDGKRDSSDYKAEKSAAYTRGDLQARLAAIKCKQYGLVSPLSSEPPAMGNRLEKVEPLSEGYGLYEYIKES